VNKWGINGVTLTPFILKGLYSILCLFLGERHGDFGSISVFGNLRISHQSSENIGHRLGALEPQAVAGDQTRIGT
jgi:hypothetical protein